MRTLAEVLALQDTGQKIYYLKKARKTDLPDAVKLYNDWNPNKHEIITTMTGIPTSMRLSPTKRNIPKSR